MIKEKMKGVKIKGWSRRFRKKWNRIDKSQYCKGKKEETKAGSILGRQ